MRVRLLHHSEEREGLRRREALLLAEGERAVEELEEDLLRRRGRAARLRVVRGVARRDVAEERDPLLDRRRLPNLAELARGEGEVDRHFLRRRRN